jgi:hypothetical protein
MQRPSLLALPILAGLGLAACEDVRPLPPDETRAHISTDLASVLRESRAAYQGGTEALPGAAASAAADRIFGSDSSIALRVRSAMSRLTAAPVRGSALPADPQPDDTDQQIAFLNEKLFIDANYLGDGIYQVPPSLVCAETTIDSTGHTIETIDQVCAEKLAAADLRVQVIKTDDTIRFGIQVDAKHDEPLAIFLERNAISVTVDLDDAWRAVVALAPLFGQEAPNASLSGEITGRLEVLGAAHAKATLDIDRPVSVKFAQAGVSLDGPDAYRFSSDAAKVLSIELDGAAQHGSFAVGLGATAAHILVVDSGTTATRDTIDLDLPGLTARADFDAGRPLSVSNISLGKRTTSISRNGRLATSIDLNPDDGRALSAVLERDPATLRDTLSVSPKLDVRVFTDHAVWGDTAPVYDVTQVLLEGSVRSAATGDRLEVVDGQLRISTNPASYGFSAAAGQCVSGRDVEDLPSGSFYTQWTVGTCQ